MSYKPKKSKVKSVIAWGIGMTHLDVLTILYFAFREATTEKEKNHG